MKMEKISGPQNIGSERDDLYEHFRFVADKGQAPLRVDKYLMNKVENATRNRIQKSAKDGNIFVKTPKEMDVHYRNVTTLRQNYALSAVMRGHAGTKPEIDAVIAQSLVKRRQSQPVAASAGCIFKNPENIPAGKLIEELGFKSFAVGSARVSDIHGNFIVNDGGATAKDVLTLIHEIQIAAERDRGISLETEVQIVGVDL